MKKNTEIMIFLALLLIPVYFFRFKILGLPTNIFEIMVFLALCSTVFYNYKKIFRIENIRIYFLALLFILAGVVSLFLSADRTAALGILKGWILVPVVFAWVMVKNSKPDRIQAIAIPFSISLLAISLWAVLQRYHLVSALFYQKGNSSFDLYFLNGRAFGPFESPNFLAMYLVPALFLSLPVITYIKSRFTKNIVALLFVLPILTLIYSGSLGGLVAFLAATVLFLLVYSGRISGKNSSRLKIILPSLWVLANVIFLFLAIKYPDLLSKQDKFRGQIYDYSLSLLRGHPILGLGLADFQSKMADLTKTDLLFTWFGLPYALHPHNLFLALWLSMGLLGLIVFLILIAEFIGGIFKTGNRLNAGLGAAMTAILVHGLFDTTYFKNDLSAIFWLLIALNIVVSNKNDTAV